MTDRVARAKRLIEAIRREHKRGAVCDSVLRCEGWERYCPTIFSDITDNFKFCPYCGKSITQKTD